MGSPHPPQAVPLPLRGEGLSAAELWARLRMSGTIFSSGFHMRALFVRLAYAVNCSVANRLTSGGITSSTASGPPSPTRGRLKRPLVEANLRISSFSPELNFGLQCFACRMLKLSRPTGQSRPLLAALRPSPRRGRGTALAGDEVIPPDVDCF